MFFFVLNHASVVPVVLRAQARPLDLVVSLGDLKDHGVQQWCAAMRTGPDLRSQYHKKHVFHDVFFGFYLGSWGCHESKLGSTGLLLSKETGNVSTYLGILLLKNGGFNQN